MSEENVWKYCVVGNIVKISCDDTNNLRYGTSSFSGGIKVYLCGKYWNNSQKTIEVIGLSRGKQYQVVDVPVDLIENIRCQKVFKPAVLSIMDN